MRTIWRSLLSWLRSRTIRRSSALGRDSKSAREVVLDIETTALSPSQGKIICIGMLLVDGSKIQEKVFAGPLEKSLLGRFWKTIKHDDYLIGHNVINFDLYFILIRSKINGVKPTRRFELRRHSTAFVYDTMQVDSAWGRKRYKKLDALAKAYGVPGKKGSGKGVYNLYRQKQWKQIEKYCRGDLWVTWNVYRHMKNCHLDSNG